MYELRRETFIVLKKWSIYRIYVWLWISKHLDTYIHRDGGWFLISFLCSINLHEKDQMGNKVSSKNNKIRLKTVLTKCGMCVLNFTSGYNQRSIMGLSQLFLLSGNQLFLRIEMGKPSRYRAVPEISSSSPTLCHIRSLNYSSFRLHNVDRKKPDNFRQLHIQYSSTNDPSKCFYISLKARYSGWRSRCKSKVQIVSEWLINQNFRYQFSLIRPRQSPPKHQPD